jgi:hypothetical protein
MDTVLAHVQSEFALAISLQERAQHLEAYIQYLQCLGHVLHYLRLDDCRQRFSVAESRTLFSVARRCLEMSEQLAGDNALFAAKPSIRSRYARESIRQMRGLAPPALGDAAQAFPEMQDAFFSSAPTTIPPSLIPAPAPAPASAPGEPAPMAVTPSPTPGAPSDPSPYCPALSLPIKGLSLAGVRLLCVRCSPAG